MIDFEEDVVGSEVTGTQLKRLTGLSQELIELREHIERAKENLKELTDKEFRLSSDTIPQYMKEVGMETFKLTNGEQLEIIPKLKVSLNKANKPWAYKYMEENGAADLIKHNVAVVFGKAEDEKAILAIKLLEEGGFEPSDELNVHPSTLKSWVKKRLEAGEELDQTRFGVFEYNLTKITQSKKEKF